MIGIGDAYRYAAKPSQTRNEPAIIGARHRRELSAFARLSRDRDRDRGWRVPRGATPQCLATDIIAQWKALDARHAITLFESRKAPLRPPQAGRDLFAVTNTLFATAGDIVELLGEPGSLGGGRVAAWFGRTALARGVHQRELTGLTAAARGGIGIIPTRRG